MFSSSFGWLIFKTSFIELSCFSLNPTYSAFRRHFNFHYRQFLSSYLAPSSHSGGRRTPGVEARTGGRQPGSFPVRTVDTVGLRSNSVCRSSQQCFSRRLEINYLKFYVSENTAHYVRLSFTQKTRGSPPSGKLVIPSLPEPWTLERKKKHRAPYFCGKQCLPYINKKEAYILYFITASLRQKLESIAPIP